MTKRVGKNKDVGRDFVARYTFRVTWSEDDREYVGLCAEFPSLSHLDPDRHEALRGIEGLVADVVAEMMNRGENAPVPLASRSYSGQFKVRVPEALHRHLVLEAAEQGVSMNRLVSMKLAHG